MEEKNEMQEDREQSPLDFFVGGVPPLAIFTMHLVDIEKLLQMPGIGYTGYMLAYIGVVSYTEAFFKDHFASVLNMFPEKCAVLQSCGRDVSVDVPDLLKLEDPLQSKLGFVLSERFNFGSPKTTNSLFKDLLLLTPFSKDSAVAFDRVLEIRNVLVHHGGTPTIRFKREDTGFPSYFDSVSIKKIDVAQAALLSLKIVKSTAVATVSRLSPEIKNCPTTDPRKNGVEFLQYDLSDCDELISRLEALITTESASNESQTISDDEIPF